MMNQLVAVCTDHPDVLGFIGAAILYFKYMVNHEHFVAPEHIPRPKTQLAPINTKGFGCVFVPWPFLVILRFRLPFDMATTNATA